MCECEYCQDDCNRRKEALKSLMNDFIKRIENYDSPVREVAKEIFGDII